MKLLNDFIQRFVSCEWRRRRLFFSSYFSSLRTKSILIALGLGDVYQIGMDHVYSETSWWTMTSGGGVRGVPEAWIRMQKCTENITRSTEPLKGHG